MYEMERHGFLAGSVLITPSSLIQCYKLNMLTLLTSGVHFLSVPIDRLIYKFVLYRLLLLFRISDLEDIMRQLTDEKNAVLVKLNEEQSVSF